MSFCLKAGYRPELAWSCCEYANTLLVENMLREVSLLPEILLLETGGRPSLEVVFVAVCDAVLRALKGNLC